MPIIDTIADLESLMAIMDTFDIAEIQLEGIVIKTRPKPINIAGQAKVSDDDILMNPYAGLKV